MKRIFINLFLILLFPLAISAQNFELEKNSEGIQVYNRINPRTQLKEFRGETKIKTSLSSLIALLDDSPSFNRWMHTCSQAKLIKKQDFYNRINYIINQAPWPLANRDMIVSSHLIQDSQTGTIIIQLEGKKDYLPEKEGLIRVPVLEGFWQFTPLKNGEVKIVYQIFSSSGGNIPSMFANTTSVDLPFKTLNNMKKIIHEEKYRNAKFKEIMDDGFEKPYFAKE